MKQYKYVFISGQKLAHEANTVKHLADTVKDFGEQGWLYIGTKPLLDASLAIFEREAIMVNGDVLSDDTKETLDNMTSALYAEMKARA